MRYVSFTLLPLLLTCCMPYTELPVEYDYSYKGDFQKYKTFDLFLPASEEDASLQNAVIENLIVERMKFLGYERSSDSPNLLISYKVFNDSLKFFGYKQPDINIWAKSKSQELDYDLQKFNLNHGTLLIQLYDRAQNRSIWQGYATTNYGAIAYNDERSVRNAVLSILDKYRFFASGFGEEFDFRPVEKL